ncbi:MAG: L-histidine N(alpha)-methyltransferase [Planctomycetes bacterium]|nr:L-histidine N(alpha)-methyltransferase [Planctomycetota bacterium]
MSLPQRTPAPRDPRSLTFLQGAKPPVQDAAAALRAGLLAARAAIPPRFFYDELGSRLFAAITALDAYYPTRTEARVMQDHLPAIAAALPVTGCTLVDVGAGNCEKAAGLFATVQPSRYVAVDISTEFLRDALLQLQRRFPAIEMCGVATDFAQRLELPPAVPPGRRLFFYPGSSIGNFSPPQAVLFLQSLREQMRGDGVLWIGVDLQKPTAILERAYDDELGVTAAFNKNVLQHVNRLAGTDFDVRDWRHVAFYDEAIGRIEMHLEAARAVEVRWPGGARSFGAGERIHTENSYKYTTDGFGRLLADAGLRSAGCWTDPQGWFGVFVAEPR